MKRVLGLLAFLAASVALGQGYPVSQPLNQTASPLDGGPNLAVVDYTTPQTETTFLAGPLQGGGTAAPTFRALASGDFNNVIPLILPGTIAQRVHDVTISTTMSASYGIVNCSTGAGNIVLTLPAATGSSIGVTAFKSTTDANTCTIAVTGGDTILGATSIVMTQAGEWATVQDRATGSWWAQRGLGYVQLSAIPIVPIGPGVGSNFGNSQLAGSSLPGWVDAFGIAGGPIGQSTYQVQPLLTQLKYTSFASQDGANFTFYGLRLSNADSAVVTTPANATTNRYTRSQRTIFTGVAAVNRGSGIVASNAANGEWWRGNGAGLGGFFLHARFGWDVFVAGDTLFCGLGPNTNFFSSDPSGKAGDFIGLAKDAADTNVALFTKDNTTNTKTAIPSIPAPGSQTFYVDFFMWAYPDDTVIHYRVDDLLANSGLGATLVDTTISTTLPRNNIYMIPHCLCGSGANAGGTTAFALSKFDLWMLSNQE
jgi:hypothetical protein